MTERKVLIRTVVQRSYGNYRNKVLGDKRKGGINNIPIDMIGKVCIVMPLTSSQIAYFKEKTYGYDRAKKFINKVMLDPREMLDMIEKSNQSEVKKNDIFNKICSTKGRRSREI